MLEKAGRRVLLLLRFVLAAQAAATGPDNEDELPSFEARSIFSSGQSHNDRLKSSGRRLRMAASTLSVRTVFLKYTDTPADQASTTDEAFWSSQTFGASNSVRAGFLSGSYGRVNFDSSGSDFYVATMGYSASSIDALTSCPAMHEILHADALSSAAGYDAGSYDLLEYWFDSNFKSKAKCGYNGAANPCVALLEEATAAAAARAEESVVPSSHAAPSDVTLVRTGSRLGRYARAVSRCVRVLRAARPVRAGRLGKS